MSVLDKITKAGQDAAKKTKDFTDISQRKIQIAKLEDELKKMYTALGTKYYRDFSANPAPELQEICQSICQQIDKINVLNSEIEAIKAVPICPYCNAILEDDSPFCTNCGKKVKGE